MNNAHVLVALRAALREYQPEADWIDEYRERKQRSAHWEMVLWLTKRIQDNVKKESGH